MKKQQILIQKLPNLKELDLPTYATNGSAGMDLYAAIEEDIVLQPSTHTLIPTGIAIALSPGYEAQIRPRSGLANKYGITVLNTPGTIDSDYRGEVCALLINHSNKAFTIKRGYRIAQMIISEYFSCEWNVVETLPQSDRGMGGLGSTGHKA
jgi:dUTP pyrophosphatase